MTEQTTPDQQGAAESAAPQPNRKKAIVVASVVVAALAVTAVTFGILNSRGSNDRVVDLYAGRNDNDFIADITESLVGWGLHVDDAGFTRGDLIAIGEEVCTRGAEGEDWKDLSVDVPMEALERLGITDDTATGDNIATVMALAATISAAYTYLCPTQFDVAIEQIVGFPPIQ